MYLLKNNNPAILVIKHLEAPLIDELPALALKTLKDNVLLGLYIGHVSGAYNVKSLGNYRFIIAPPTIADIVRSRNYTGPILELSGFNFIPAWYFASEATVAPSRYAVYVGNFQKRKNLVGAMRLGLLLLNTREVGELVLVLQSKNAHEKILRFLLRIIFFRKTQINVVPKVQNINCTREEVHGYIQSSLVVLAPYLSEGAARVVAEAEALGKPLIINEEMEGGSLDFIKWDENIFYKSGVDSNLSVNKLKIKDRQEKKLLYGDASSLSAVKLFFREYFSVELNIAPGSLVNAFSSHRNEIPEIYTSAEDDQIQSSCQLFQFLEDYNVAGIDWRQKVKVPRLPEKKRPGGLRPFRVVGSKALYSIVLLVAALRLRLLT